MNSIVSSLAVLATPGGLLELLILMFLEMALGIDNLVFIMITTNRLPEDKQHIGRRLGLVAAMVMRCILLCCVVWIMSIDIVLVVLPFGAVNGTSPISVRDVVFILGGVYLIYKGFSEMRDAIQTSEEGCDGDMHHKHKAIGLLRAVLTIMVMDIVFSFDSVITAAGLSGHIVIMCMAVICAVLIMIVFADLIGDFINDNAEIKIVALGFIFLVGVMLVFEGFSIREIAGVSLNSTLYCMMVFGLVIALLIMVQRRKSESCSAITESEGFLGSSTEVCSKECETVR